MKYKTNKKNNQDGLSLIEVLVSVGIIAMIVLGIYSLIILSLNITADNKYYVEASEIANQQMEQIMNLPYALVGTDTGIPTGTIPQFNTIIRDGTYTVHNSIRYYDDSYDGVDAADSNGVNADYKIVTVEVSWQTRYGTKSLSVFAKIIPSTEEMLTYGGLLRIIVVNANGQPIQGATVHIVNTSQGIDITDTTSASGTLSYPGAPASYEGYAVTVTKSGYGADATYPRTAANPNPTRPQLTVTNYTKTEESFSIDLLAALNIYTLSKSLPNNWKVNTDTSGENQTNSRLDIDSSGNIYIVWQDYRSASNSRVYAQKYSNTGTKLWTSDVNISNSNMMILPDTRIDADGNLYVCWNHDNGGNQDAYLIKLNSADGSEAWTSEKKINTTADSADQKSALMALLETGSAANAMVVWADNRNGDDDLYIQNFDVDKNALFGSEIRLNGNTLGDTTDQNDPAIISTSTYAYISWTDTRNANSDIYAQKIDNSGAILWGSDLLVSSASTTADQTLSDIAVDPSGNILITWTDDSSGNEDVYIKKIDPSGASLWSSDVRVNLTASGSAQYSSDIAIDPSGNIFVVWTDTRDGNPDIYAQKLDADGIHQWSSDQRVNIHTGASNQLNPDIRIDPSTGDPFVVWQDDRSGDYDIYITKFGDPAPTSSVPNMPISIHGTSQIGNSPVIYELDSDTWTNASGFLAMSVEWDSGYTVTLNSASTTYDIVLSDPTIPFPLMPAETKNLYLYVTP